MSLKWLWENHVSSNPFKGFTPAIKCDEPDLLSRCRSGWGQIGVLTYQGSQHFKKKNIPWFFPDMRHFSQNFLTFPWLEKSKIIFPDFPDGLGTLHTLWGCATGLLFHKKSLNMNMGPIYFKQKENGSVSFTNFQNGEHSKIVKMGLNDLGCIQFIVCVAQDSKSSTT